MMEPRPLTVPFLGLAVLALATWSTGAAAQPGDALASSSGEARVTIVRPLTVAALDDLDFGCIVASGTGTVFIDAASGVPTYSGGARPASSAAGCGGGSASFAVSGEAGRSYRVSIERDTLARLQGAVGVTLPVTGLQARSDNAPGSSSEGRLDGAGRDLLRVGGTLEVPFGSRPGRYTARIMVTLAYS